MGKYFEQTEDFSLWYPEMEDEVLNEDLLNLEDGFWKTRNTRGYVDLEYWAKCTGMTVDQLIERAAGTYIWQDPVRYEFSGKDPYAGWIVKEQYLMGNLIKKYKEAVHYNEQYGLFEENIKVLKENLPETVAGEDIHVNLGSTWLLSIKGFVENFIAELLEMPVPPDLSYDPVLGDWDLECNSHPNEVLNYEVYGTLDSSALDIILLKINGKPLKAMDTVFRLDGSGYTSILNKEKTLIKQEKGRKIDQRLNEYCHETEERNELISNAYMNALGYGVSRIDGSNFTFSETANHVIPHKHQKDAIAHSFVSPNVLFADCTGAGKTLEYCFSVHEMLRLGIVKKAMVVVPKTNLNAAYHSYIEMFPEDRVFCIQPNKEFSPANRIDTIDEMVSDTYQVLFIASTSFDMFKMSKSYVLRKKNAEIRNIKIELSCETSYYRRKRLQRYLDKLGKEKEKLEEEYPENELTCFEALEIDLLVVDEAHNYKNISLNYHVENIVGMHRKGSKKADSMLEKVEYIQKKQGRIIFATATPLPNSMADLYVLQRYLQPEELKNNQLYHFNDWINTFCEEEHGFEVDVDGMNGRIMTRFSHFHNLPELMAMFSQVCHFYQGGEELGLPIFRGYSDITVKQSDALRSYMEEIAARVDAVRKHEVDNKTDNILKINIQGRLATLDLGTLGLKETETEETKVRVSAKNIMRLYTQYPDHTQIVFSDLSTPKDGFNVYDELKSTLVELGVPADQVMFIHDADTGKKRLEVEKLFNEGKVRILIGSTRKLGTGTNVQERLIALHMLDAPWRPADFEQRCGRILRQGNTCKEVFIYRYVTEKSFDAYTYQILENKQKFISQFLSGTLSILHRSETDCADTILNYAEIKALAIGNPLIKDRVETANKLEQTKIHQRQRKKELQRLEETLFHLPAQIDKRQVLIENTRKDWNCYEKQKEVIPKEERLSFGEELLWALSSNIRKEKERIFSEYQGATVVLPKHMDPNRKYVFLKFASGNQYSVSMETDKPMGCCQRLDHCLEGLPKRLEHHEQYLSELFAQERSAKEDLLTGNRFDAEVQVLREKLKEMDELLEEGSMV